MAKRDRSRLTRIDDGDRSQPAHSAMSGRSTPGGSLRRRSERRLASSWTGTKLGSKANGKPAVHRAARAMAWLVRSTRSGVKSSVRPISVEVEKRNRSPCRRWGNRCPSPSVVTDRAPPSRVVVIMRSTSWWVGSKSAVSPLMARVRAGKKYSSPCSSDVGWPRNGGRSRLSSWPCSAQRSRSIPRSALALTCDRASNAPLTPPADVPETTSIEAQVRARSSTAAYRPSGRPEPLRSARTSASISRTVPPIQTARLTPPLRTRASRSSSGGTSTASLSILGILGRGRALVNGPLVP